MVFCWIKKLSGRMAHYSGPVRKHVCTGEGLEDAGQLLTVFTQKAGKRQVWLRDAPMRWRKTVSIVYRSLLFPTDTYHFRDKNEWKYKLKGSTHSNKEELPGLKVKYPDVMLPSSGANEHLQKQQKTPRLGKAKCQGLPQEKKIRQGQTLLKPSFWFNQ